MTTHITLRLAWHNDGWNGRICEKPAENSYCVGCSSYPGELIRERRDLDWEKANAGRRIADLDRPPACMYSSSTFSDKACTIESEKNMNRFDRQLGMDKDISRRDFLNGVSIAVGASLLPGTACALDVGAQDVPGYYTPELTGMRGSHPGSFETAHLVLDGASFDAE